MVVVTTIVIIMVIIADGSVATGHMDIGIQRKESVGTDNLS